MKETVFQQNLRWRPHTTHFFIIINTVLILPVMWDFVVCTFRKDKVPIGYKGATFHRFVRLLFVEALQII